jgi:hypothetical protein
LVGGFIAHEHQVPVLDDWGVLSHILVIAPPYSFPYVIFSLAFSHGAYLPLYLDKYFLFSLLAFDNNIADSFNTYGAAAA